MEHQPKVDGEIEREHRVRRRDRAIAKLAERQHGVVSRAQLLGMGIGHGAIDHRVKRGRLHVEYRGVYAVGHRALTLRAKWMAAVLSAGEGAALSHRAAAALLGLRNARAAPEVTVARWLPSRPALRIHQGRLPTDEVTDFNGIPVTTIPRTLLDLATVLDKRQVERAMEEAERRRLDDPIPLTDLLSRYPRRRGTSTVRAILDAGELGTTYTRSELEERFVAFVRANSLPSPELNVPIELSPGRWIEADCLWRAERVIVELDSHGSHRTAGAFERDRARDRASSVAGWTVIRVTWRQLHFEPVRLAADLQTLLHRTTAA